MSMMAGLVRDWFELARSRRARPFLLVAFLIDVAFLFIFLVAIQSYLPEQYGGGRGLPGYSLAAYGLAKLVAQLFAGRLADRLGHARAALVGVLFILTGQVALLAAVAMPYAALPSAAIYGFGAAVLWPALYARASHEFAEGERAKLAAALSVTTGIALVCGLSLGLLLPGGFPYWAAVILGAAVVVLAVIPTIALRRDGAYISTLEQENPTLRAMIATALDRRRIEFALIILFESAAVGALQAIFRAYGRDFLGVSFRLELLYLVPAMLAGAGAVVIGGALADRLGRLLLVGAGYVVAGVALWLLANTTTPFVLIPLAAAGGVGAGLAMPAISALSMDLSRTAGQGTVLAWFMVMEGLGHAGGAGLGGWLNMTSDPAAVLRLAGGLFLVTGAGAALSVAGWPGSWAARARARGRSSAYPEKAA
jgi:MFS family permease